MAMKPRDAANAKGCIDCLMSFTRAKLLPHVPEMTIRFTQRTESGTSPHAPPAWNTETCRRRNVLDPWYIIDAGQPLPAGLARERTKQKNSAVGLSTRPSPALGYDESASF
jgi:hypothetical protein